MSRYVCILFILLFLPGCEDTNVLVATDAALDAITAITLNDEQVSALARQAATVADGKNQVAPPDNPYAARLQRLVAGYSQRDGRIFNYKVYLTKEVNAFAMADGTVRVYSGLMDLMGDEELLFVIGHEMGHVVLNHSKEKVRLAYGSSAIRKGLASQDNEIGQIARSVLGDLVEQLTNAQFSQHEEREADRYGAAFLQAEGHELAGAVSALNKLAELARQHTFLSSHPDPGARAKKLLEGETGSAEERESLAATLLGYGKALLVGLLNVLGVVLEWLLSFI